MIQIAELPPFPTGWYALGASAELARGAVWSRTFFGRELVVFRTASGAVHAVDAYCPHLGAHMGHGGTVEGEHLRCPFHGFEFDGSGRCVLTAYGTPPPAKARVSTWCTMERNGWILVWGDVDGAAPSFDIPALDQDGWLAPQWREWNVRSHPQETTENSVDLGHLTVVHGYDAVRVLDELETDGPYLTSRYTMTRLNPFWSKLPPIVSNFRVHVHGLGYSQVDIEVERYGFRFRLFVLPQPMDGERITLRVGLSGRELSRDVPGLPGWMRRLDAGTLSRLIASQALQGAAHDVEQDFDMWQHKVYVHPMLAQGDGPIGRYRRWCRQFYARSAAMAAE